MFRLAPSRAQGVQLTVSGSPSLAFGRLPAQLLGHRARQPDLNDGIHPFHALAQPQRFRKLVAANEFFERSVANAKDSDDFAFFEQADVF